MLTRRVFDENMAALAAARGEKITSERIQIYWRILNEDLNDAQMEHATAKLLRTSGFFPAIAEIRKAAGIRSVLELYRKPFNGKCECEVSISFADSHRRGWCNICWRKVLEANGATPEDERRELAQLHGKRDDKPKALPRSGDGRLGITGSDFDV